MNTLEQLRSGQLAGARRIALSEGLTELPREVFQLADSLEVLDLSGNRLQSLPPDMGRLHRLKIVFGSNNPFTRLPPSLGDCPALEMVGFKACQIREVPAEALPARLRWLILTDNAVEQLPDALGERPALQKLMLAGNRLSALPAGLAQAGRLELLRISANHFRELPAWLTALPRLAWLACAGNPLGWQRHESPPLPQVPWQALRLLERLGEGASGHIHRVQLADHRALDSLSAETAAALPPALALKLFKSAVTSDGLPEHEIAACRAAGRHAALCTPGAALAGHPDGQQGLLLPLLPPELVNLAGPPSLQSCTRDVYAPGFFLSAKRALGLACRMADALDHLHRHGVMHGDFYAHNMLWNPASGDAMLSDLGGATLLPEDQPALRAALLALDVRAFGCLLEELLQHAEAPPPEDAASWSVMGALADACLSERPAERPAMDDVRRALQAV